MTLLDDYISLVIALTKTKHDKQIIDNLLNKIEATGIVFKCNVADKQDLTKFLLNEIATISETKPPSIPVRSLVKNLAEMVFTSSVLLPDYYFTTLIMLITKYGLGILDSFKLFYCNDIQIELDFILKISRGITINYAKLIMMGVDQSFFAAYKNKNHLFNIIVYFSIYGLINGSPEQETCICAARIISQFDNFQVSVPQSNPEAERKLETLLRRGYPLHCFNSFPVQLLKNFWASHTKGNKDDIYFDICLINAGRTPTELSIECSANNNKLLEISSLYYFEAQLAMFKLVNEHGFILPENAFDLHIANINTMYYSTELSEVEMFLLANFLQYGVKGATKLLAPSPEHAADVYIESITNFKDSKSMINLGLLYQFGKLKAGEPEYQTAAYYYAMAIDTNNEPLAEYNLNFLRTNRLIV